MSVIYTALIMGLLFGCYVLIAEFFKRKAKQKAPRITRQEWTAYRQSLADAALPMARIETSDADTPPAGSRLGGVPCKDDQHADWPRSVDGFPMLFLGQVNFAEFPRLPDFPDSGLVQFFICVNDKGQPDMIESPEAFSIRWVPTPEAAETLQAPAEFAAFGKRSAFSRRFVSDGRAIRFTEAQAPGNPFNWPFSQDMPDIYGRLAETDDLDQDLRKAEEHDDLTVESYGTHWIGGQPSFVQEDVRYDESLQHLDRVLLHIGWDDDICMGDAGQMNILIGQEDLRALRFDKAFYTLDCS